MTKTSAKVEMMKNVIFPPRLWSHLGSPEGARAPNPHFRTRRSDPTWSRGPGKAPKGRKIDLGKIVMKLCVMKLWFSRPGTSWKPPPALPWAPKPSPGWLLNPGSPPAPGNPPARSFEPRKFALCEHSRLLVRGPGPGNLAFFEVPGLPGRPGALWEVSRAWGWNLGCRQTQEIGLCECSLC